MDNPDPSIEPEKKPEHRAKGWLGTLAAAAIVAISKFKFLLIGLKFFGASWTFILSLAFYVAFFGWRFGLVIILMLAAHEFGHYFAYRAYGLPVRIPVFIPFFGAYTQGAIAPELEHDAYIALAGPLTGLVIAGASYGFGLLTNEHFWFACASFSAFLNLLNMIPILPFDGGRVIAAIWAPLWILGAVLFIGAAFYIHIPILLVAIIALMGIPAMIAAFRGERDPRAAAMTNEARGRVGIWYIVTALGLILILGKAQGAFPPNTGL